MKNEPRVDLKDIDNLYYMLGGFAAFETLSAAARLGLFTTLSENGPLGFDDLRKHLGLQELLLRILLLGCSCLGLISRSGDVYRNAPVSDVYLNAQSEKNILSHIELCRDRSGRARVQRPSR